MATERRSAPPAGPPRLAPLPPDERDDAARELLAQATRVGGATVNIFATLVRHPGLFRRWLPFGGKLLAGKLPARDRELLILRTGWLCGSEYEWAQHVGNVGRARDYGLEPVNIAKGPDAGWDAFEAAILRAADELYRDAVVSDATWKTLSGRFDEGLMMAAVFTASSYRATAMALNAFGVQLEPEDERFPQVAAR
jgi:alkylhydroperoxidase family enzyme